MQFAKGVLSVLIGASVILNADAKPLFKAEDFEDIREPLIESMMQQFLPFMRSLENKVQNSEALLSSSIESIQQRIKEDEDLFNSSMNNIKKKVSGIKSTFFSISILSITHLFFNR